MFNGVWQLYHHNATKEEKDPWGYNNLINTDIPCKSKLNVGCELEHDLCLVAWLNIVYITALLLN